jgi:hypothetical protein
VPPNRLALGSYDDLQVGSGALLLCKLQILSEWRQLCVHAHAQPCMQGLVTMPACVACLVLSIFTCTGQRKHAHIAHALIYVSRVRIFVTDSKACIDCNYNVPDSGCSKAADPLRGCSKARTRLKRARCTLKASKRRENALNSHGSTCSLLQEVSKVLKTE